MQARRGAEYGRAAVQSDGTELARIQEDIDWFVEKYDYRNKDANWKNSKDAVPRTMQKITGGYPADPVFKQK